MSAALLELAPTPAATDTPVIGTQRRLRSAFPVGARFPRRVPADSSVTSSEVRVSTSSAPVFPIGARFPRRSPVDVVIYLSEREIGGPAATSRRVYPVGARFPRR